MEMVVLYDGSRKTLYPYDLISKVLEKKIVVVTGNMTEIGKWEICTDKAVFCSAKYQGYLKAILGELCISELVFLKYVTNLSFVSNGFEVEPIGMKKPPWSQYAGTYPLGNDGRIETEFLPYLGAPGVIASPLDPGSFLYSPRTEIGRFAHMYVTLHNRFITNLIKKTKETALAMLEEETGIKRGKSYEELMRIAEEKAKEVIKREKIKLFLKFESKIDPNFEKKIVPNPLVPERLFPELKTIAEQIKEIPEDAEEQLALLREWGDRHDS
ncbi:MAG: hypothetical protein QW532_00040 [Archaeoglobaceae archaeon]